MKTRDRIINAAIPVFAKKGRHGAHMEEIAKAARINKAMIYYIFHNKDELYLETLKHVFDKTWASFMTVNTDISNNLDDYKMVFNEYITKQINFFYENSDYTRVLVDAMSNGPEEISLASRLIKENHKDNDPKEKMKNFIDKGKAEKFIRDINTDQLIISITGMVIIYFLTQSITETMDIEIDDETQFMEARKESIIDLVLNGILITEKADNKKKQNRSQGA
jgi:AcrR family transcriptional regulator